MRGGERGDYSWEVIILNVAIKGGRLFEGGDYSRDGYYSRKYGTLIKLNTMLPLVPYANKCQFCFEK